MIEVSVIDAATEIVLLDALVDPGGIGIVSDAHAVHGLAAADLVDAPRWPVVLDVEGPHHDWMRAFGVWIG